MKPLDEEQLAAIEAALKRHAWGGMPENVMAELRPKPKFAEGQVAYDPINDEYFKVTKALLDTADSGIEDCRPLNLTELGPDVKALRDALEWYLNEPLMITSHGTQEIRHHAADALADFDAKHKGE